MSNINASKYFIFSLNIFIASIEPKPVSPLKPLTTVAPQLLSLLYFEILYAISKISSEYSLKTDLDFIPPEKL